MFNLGQAIGYLLLDTSGFTSGFQTAKASLQQFMDSSGTAQDRVKALGNAFTGAGAAMTKNVTLPLVGLGTVAAKAAIDYESAFAGVRKTVDATEEEYAQLSDSIIEMSNRLPQSASDIAGVMEVAGQLGVRGTDNLLSFTETMIMLGDATNLSSEEAATALARVMNIMGTAPEDVSRLGATVVALGNNFATTESEVVQMTNRLAAGAKLAGLTEAETMALATAMSSVGIQAEAGGTAMTQTFNEIEKAVAESQEKFKEFQETVNSEATFGEFIATLDEGEISLQEFARISGMSSEEFAEAWENKPIEAIQSFIEGIGKLDENGESAVVVLDNLGLTGIRQSNMLKSLGLASDLLGDSINLANQAWEDNSALTKEAETRYGTLASKISILWNNVKNLAISFGTLLMPAIDRVTEVVQKAIQWLNGLDDSQKKTIVTILGIVAAIGPVLLIIGKVLSVISTIIGVIKAVKTAIIALNAVMAANPIVLVIAAIAALVAAFIYFWNTSEEFRNFWINLWETIKNAVSVAVDWVVNAFQAVVEWFSNLGSNIQQIWESVKTAVSEGIQNIIQSIVEFATNLYNGAVDAFTRFKDGAIEKWNEFKDWVSESVDGIVETVSGIASKLYEAGASWITSLWDGAKSIWDSIAGWISEKVGWVADKLSGLASSAGAEGSYATGTDYILSDRIVKVHEGEAILSKQEISERMRGRTSGSSAVPIVINVTEQIDGMTLARNQYKYNILMDDTHGMSLIKA